MKKAFTMMELIFVLVVIGILAAVIAPRMERDPLREAGIQLVSHIRYTQHLALVDDKYDAGDNNWYRNKWQIMFENGGVAGDHSYTIFSDYVGNSTGNADYDEIARNPQDQSKKLTGGTNGVHYDDVEATKSMSLGSTYGVENVVVSGGGGTTTAAQRVLFDYLGRPFKKNTDNINSALDGLAASPIYIKICSETCNGDNNKSTNDNELVIRIENETGFSCILQQNDDTNCI